MSNQKVGLISVSIHNYGSLLQTYAMQRVLDNYGIENEIILFKSDPVKQIYRILNFPFMKMKMKLYNRKLKTRLFHKEIYKGSAIRDGEFMRFKKTFCRFTPKFTERSELIKAGKKYRAFVLGSDQVWNPANLEMDFYTMNFVPLETPKIAYAPSFGVSSIPKKQIEKTKSYLDKIQYISVRETSGAKIVKKLIGREVPVVCDPTALLKREEWDRIKSSKKYTNEKYIFCYFLGANPDHRKWAEEVKKQTGYKIVALQHIDEFVKGDLKFGDITPYDVGPQDFVSLIANAEIVLTDSFHGTMFSIYYQKKFFTFPRYDETKKDSTNSRIVSILEMMNIRERFISGKNKSMDVLSEEINWNNVQEKLEKFRADSYKYLTDSLKDSNVI